MQPIKLFLFGEARLAYGAAERPLPLSRISRALLAFLVIQQRAVPREVVIDAIWRETDDVRGRNALNTALWRLRQTIRENLPRGTMNAAISGGEVRFDPPARWWIDVPAFERGVGCGLGRTGAVPSAEALIAFQQALTLYSGDFLEGYYYDWVQLERERLRSVYLAGLEDLMRHLAMRGDTATSIITGERILQLDPIREEVHRFIIWLYARNGQRDRAIKQYQICRDVLQAELEIAPSEETSELFERVRRPNALRQLRPLPARPGSNPATRSVRYRDALNALQEASEQLERATRLFRSLSGED